MPKLYQDKENATANRPVKNRTLSNQQIQQISERIPLRGRQLSNQGVKGAGNSQNNRIKSIKRTNSLLLDDSDLKKKIQVQKDSDKPKAPLRRRKIQSKNNEVDIKRQKLDSPTKSNEERDYQEVETVPLQPDPIAYVPENYTPLTDEDLKYFYTKKLVPEKNPNFKETSTKLDSLMSFDEIPDVELELDLSDIDQHDDRDLDNLIKKQPRVLDDCNVKLINQEIPNLHFDSVN